MNRGSDEIYCGTSLVVTDLSVLAEPAVLQGFLQGTAVTGSYDSVHTPLRGSFSLWKAVNYALESRGNFLFYVLQPGDLIHSS